MKVYRVIIISIVTTVLFGATILAQTNGEVNAGIQFNFSTPGARSLAMGGAFVGLANDATAAFANPAGLLQIDGSEVSLEARHFGFTDTFTDRGHGFAFASGIGVDAVEGVRTAETTADVTGLSFLSYVHVPERRNWAFSVYRHELVNFRTAFRAQGAFFSFLDSENNRDSTRLFPIIADFDLEIVNFGLSGALRLSDGLHVGLGVSFYDFEIDSLQQRFDFGGNPDPSAQGGSFGPPDYSAGNEVNFQEQVGVDDDVGFNLGLLWQPVDILAIGAVFRKGPELGYDVVNRYGAVLESPQTPRGTVISAKRASFNVPDVWAVGLAVKPSDQIRVTFDYDRIEYSALTADVVSLFHDDEDLAPRERAALDALSLDDGDSYHLGFEYVFQRLKCPRSGDLNCSLGVRLGSWLDPDHKVGYAGDPGVDAFTRAASILFLGGEDEIHFSAGLGFVFQRHLQIDAAIDFSDPVETVSLSAIYHFGG